MATRDMFSPPENLEEYTLNLQKDLEVIALLNGPNSPPHLTRQSPITQIW